MVMNIFDPVSCGIPIPARIIPAGQRVSTSYQHRAFYFDTPGPGLHLDCKILPIYHCAKL